LKTALFACALIIDAWEGLRVCERHLLRAVENSEARDFPQPEDAVIASVWDFENCDQLWGACVFAGEAKVVRLHLRHLKKKDCPAKHASAIWMDAGPSL
jgi:hypothetical protein